MGEVEAARRERTRSRVRIQPFLFSSPPLFPAPALFAKTLRPLPRSHGGHNADHGPSEAAYTATSFCLSRRCRRRPMRLASVGTLDVREAADDTTSSFRSAEAPCSSSVFRVDALAPHGDDASASFDRSSSQVRRRGARSSATTLTARLARLHLVDVHIQLGLLSPRVGPRTRRARRRRTSSRYCRGHCAGPQSQTRVSEVAWPLRALRSTTRAMWSRATACWTRRVRAARATRAMTSSVCSNLSLHTCGTLMRPQAPLDSRQPTLPAL
jgi:hypothetical protein